MERITNDTSPLLPVTDTDGSVLPFDFPALKVGIAEYREGPTGCTVFSFPQGVSAAIDLAGNGGQGVYYLTETLLSGDAFLNALCFAGGSLYGFEAMTGVAAEIFSDFEYSLTSMAFVSGAILFDFGRRTNVIYPDKALGRAAFRAAKTGMFPLGAHGAGCSASVGKGFERKDGEAAGQGGAFRQIGPTKIAVFTVVNARGALLNHEGQVVRGHLDQKTGQHYPIRDAFEQRYASLPLQEPSHENTTLTLVITNQHLDSRALRLLARQVHSSLARSIQPFHTMTDGDVLFAATTNEVEHPSLNVSILGIAASELAWDAVLKSF